MLKIFSWNVNGLRAVLNKGALQKFLEEYRPDVLCLQEIKAKPEQVDYNFSGYKVFWNPAKRAGYSGTAILVRESLLLLFSADLSAFDVIHWDAGRTVSFGDEPVRSVRNIRLERPNLKLYASKSNNNDSNDTSSENEEKGSSKISIAITEGRVQVLDFEKFYLVNVYTPNAKPDLSRLKLRHEAWDPEFLNLLKELRESKPVVTCGDFNAAHEEIDIARPKTNHHSAGFTDEERKGISNIVSAGFLDTFRFLHPNSVRYTWWSHWGNARANNVGWRIDYFFVSENLKAHLKSAEIYEAVTGSDHCPVSITLDFDGEE